MIFERCQGLPSILGARLSYGISDGVFGSDKDGGRRTTQTFALDGFMLDT